MSEKEDVRDEHEEEEQTQYVSKEEYEALKQEMESTRQYLQKANKEAKNYRLKVKEYEQLGEVEDIKNLMTQKEQENLQKHEKNEEWEKAKIQMLDQFEREKKELVEQNNKLKESMQRNLVQKEVTQAIGKHDGIATLLQPHVERNVRYIEDEDGNFEVRVVDNDNSPRFNNKGEYMTVDEFVASLKEDDEFGLAFRGRGQSGAGTKPSKEAGKKPRPNVKRTEMDDKQRRDFISKYGWEEYSNLPA